MRLMAVLLMMAALAPGAASAANLQPVRIILAGDSTMATKSGYGDAFCAQFRPEVTCINGGRGGRSTRSYRVDGMWDQIVMAPLKETNAPDGRPYAKTYVLMQFGHNDGSPRPERHTDVLWEFAPNLSAYAKEAKAAGASFFLVTPLTMRDFVDGKLLPDRIAPFAASMHNVAITDHLPLIDLFAESQRAVQAMGLKKANRLAGGPIPKNVLDTEDKGTSIPAVFTDASQSATPTQQAFDYTHLGPQGADYFGKMMAGLLIKAAPELKAYRR